MMNGLPMMKAHHWERNIFFPIMAIVMNIAMAGCEENLSMSYMYMILMK